MALGMRSYATDNNSIVLNATGSKKISNGSNTVNIYGSKVYINGKSLDDYVNDLIDKKLKSPQTT